MNERFHKFFMLLCIVGMGAVMFLIFNANGSNLPVDGAREGLKFNPVFLLLLLCPLLHIFMMRGHGGSHHKQEDDNADCNKNNTN